MSLKEKNNNFRMLREAEKDLYGHQEMNKVERMVGSDDPLH